jgi:hypothetical protein
VSAETKFKRNPDYIYRKIVEEAVLVPLHQDVADMECIYSLNDVAAFIWEFLEQPRSLPDLQKALESEYDASVEVLSADLERFLEELTSIGALKETA